MSYRYPHEDDSDENGFGESLQARSQAIEELDDGPDPRDNEGETDEDEDEDDDEFHGELCLYLFFFK